MIGGLHAFSDVFSVTAVDDIEGLIPVMRTAVREGMAVVLLEPRMAQGAWPSGSSGGPLR